MSATDALPWDDEERLPAMLRRVEQEAGELCGALEREYHIWRAHQPALRRAVPRGPARERWPGRRVLRHLRGVQEDAQEALEDLTGR
jgi:NTP pyrophosphatase (non-canonical NTP hydrolase)